MQIKNIKKNIPFFWIIITALFFSYQASAQDGSLLNDESTIDTDTLISVSVKVFNTYCDNNSGFGKVYFITDPHDGVVFQVLGQYPSGGNATYTFHPGEHILPAGIYTWNALPVLNSVGDPEPSAGKFIIDIKCDTVVDTDQDLTDTTTYTDDSSITDKSIESTDSSTATAIAPNPPAVFDVLRQGDTTLILFDWSNESISNISHFLLYRRSKTSDWSWKMTSKISLSECAEYACSHKVIEDNLNDGCEYAISAVDNTGLEGRKTLAKYPIAEDDDANDLISTIDEPTGVVLEETEPIATISGDLTDPDKFVIRSILSGTHVLFLETQYADSVEWHIKREPGDTFKYLGAATLNKENSMWEYVWNTTQVPNGDYVLVPKIRSSLGKEYKDTPSYITIKNKEEDSVGTKDTTLISDVKEAIPQIVRVDEDLREAEDIAKENIIDVTTPYYDKVREYINSDQSTALEKEEFTKEQERSKEYLRRLLDVESNKLLEGVLDDDEEKKERIREKIIAASNNSLDRIDEIARKLGIELSDKELELIRKEMRTRMAEFEMIIEEKKEILRGRVGPDVFEDSDKDGISNYDEINIYGTDPFDADSDNDGYVDGAEIMGGFDPKDPSVEAIIQYEEPITAGYVEEEIFSVDSISIEEIEIDENGKEKAKKISFKGTAPANSFVTLYIYSTPIIITVKTDEDGNWSYVLDKELKDGSHEIHVAITDNAGKIFAKSKPLPFVKEAAAVTINEGSFFRGGDAEPSVFDGRYLYIIVLLIIVIIGWVLIRTGPSKNTANCNL